MIAVGLNVPILVFFCIDCIEYYFVLVTIFVVLTGFNKTHKSVGIC